MDLDSLRGFVLTAGEGSIARAAPQLYLSISALSRRIQDLERELGVKLFDRTSRGLEVSEAGQRILGHAHRVLAAAAELSSAATDLHTGPSSRLGFCLGVDLPLRRLVVDALETATGTAVRCVPAPNTQLLRQLCHGRVDLALLHQAPSSPRIPSRLVARRATRLMFSSGLSQAGRRELTVHDFAGHPFVTSSSLMAGTPVYYAQLRSILAENGIEETVDVGDASFIGDVVSSGSGFAVFTGSPERELDVASRHDLVVRPVADLDLCLDTHLAWAPGSPALGPGVLDAVLDAVTGPDGPSPTAGHDPWPDASRLRVGALVPGP